MIQRQDSSVVVPQLMVGAQLLAFLVLRQLFLQFLLAPLLDMTLLLVFVVDVVRL